MNSLGQIVSAVEDYRKFVSSQVRTARADPRIGEDIVKRWRAAKERIGATVTPTGLRLPRLALPELDEPGEIARFLHEEGLPGEFPFVTAAYPEQYLEPARTADDSHWPNQSDSIPEEPTRLFAGLGLPEETSGSTIWRETSVTSASVPHSMVPRSMASVRERMASLGRSGRVGCRSTRSKTWSVCMPDLISTSQMFRFR